MHNVRQRSPKKRSPPNGPHFPCSQLVLVVPGNNNYTMSNKLHHDTEIRHLPLFQKRELAEILEVQEAWKLLMSAITEDVDGETKLKYMSRHISIIEREAAANPKLRGAEILFDEWGTSGRKRPTLQILVELLAQLQLYRAADYVSMNILGGAPVERLEIGLPNRNLDMLKYEEAETVPLEVVLEQPQLAPRTIPYEELEDYCGWNYKEQGKEECIGIGAFACVFKASIPTLNDGNFVAVKRFHSGNLNAPKQFEKELDALMKIRHKNILRMLALCDGEHKCLILELMENGNLEDNLACKNRPTPLNWKPRIKIAMEAAEGLNYLHSIKLIHRDIKSANILLDANFTAKLADFGLMQEEDESEQDNSESKMEIAGTSCYMSPEAIIYGKVSVMGDVFSFGVVLLELLTSLPADDDNRSIRSLLLYVEEMCGENSIAPLLDTKAGVWGGQGQPVAHKLYNLAIHCINREEDQRPNISSVVQKLQKIYD